MSFAPIIGLILKSLADAQTLPEPLRMNEVLLISARGGVGNNWIGGIDDPERRAKYLLKPTQEAPVKIKPGTRLYVSTNSHAILKFPEAGSCMIVGNDSSFWLPDDTEKRVTIGFDAHPVSNAKAFFNIDPKLLSIQPGRIFIIKTKEQRNGGGTIPDGFAEPLYAQVLISSKGARFFVNDYQYWTDLKGLNPTYGYGCTIGVFEGLVKVEETVTKQTFEIKPGMVVSVRPDGITPPRLPTKTEASYDIGCKLAAMGQSVPGRLPEHLCPKPKPGFATKTNSLGMIFAPLPDTRVSMCIHETRHSDFAAFVVAEPTNPGATDFVGADAFWGWEDHPIQVQWDKAVAFCEWLSRKEGKKYRLPTDREWSIAAGLGRSEKAGKDDTPKTLGRNGTSSLFPWGKEWPPVEFENLADASRLSDEPHIDNNFPNEIAPHDDGYSLSSPVMKFKPNAFGFFDLGGNVPEWCDDWFDEAREGKVVRGGSYYSSSKTSLVSRFRFARPTTFRVGFRLVMELP